MKKTACFLFLWAMCALSVAAQSYVTGVIPQYAGGIVTATTGSTIANASINTQGNFTIPVPSNPTSHVMTFTPPSNTPYSPFSLTVTAGPGTTNITAQIQAVVPQIGINIGLISASSVATDSNGNAIPGTQSGGSTPAGTNTVQSSNASGSAFSIAGPIAIFNGPLVNEYTNVPRKPMSTWLEALHNAKNQIVNLVIIGDSFSICDQTNCSVGPTTSTNRWVEQLRINLQAQYGSHGTGMVPLVANIGQGYNSESWSVSGTSNTVTTLGPSQSGNVPGSSLVHLGNGTVATFTSAIAYDTITAYCMTNSTSGTISIVIDGLAHGTACASTSGSPVSVAARSSASPLGTHTATFTSTGDSYLYAVEGTAGSTGVSVHNLGTGGAAAEYFGTAASTQLAFSDIIPGGTQAVAIMLQTNEPGTGFSTSSFTAAMNAIIAHEQALNTSTPPSVINVLPPQGSIGESTLPLFTAANIALTGAQVSPVAFDNIQDRWGTTYNSTSGLWDLGATLPGGHPNDKGNLDEYSQVYAALVDSLPASSAGGGCSNNCTLDGETTLDAGSTQTPLAMTSSHPDGTFFTISGTGSGVHTFGYQSDAFGHFLIGDFTSGGYGVQVSETGTSVGYISVGAGNAYCWMSSFITPSTQTCDTGMSRLSANSIAFGNGIPGNASATIKAATVNAGSGYQANGTPGISASGTACTITAITEGIITAATCTAP